MSWAGNMEEAAADNSVRYTDDAVGRVTSVIDAGGVTISVSIRRAPRRAWSS